MSSVAIEFSARVSRLPDYPVAGGYALPEDVALLASNESPWPPIPAVIEAASRAAAGANRYPDPSNATLRKALSDRYGVPANRIAVGNGSVDLLERHPNLVLLRTFSKAYGLAAMRAGYALSGNEAFVRAVHQVRQPFVVNGVAQAAAVEALKHSDAVAERVERTVAARVEMDDGLERLG